MPSNYLFKDNRFEVVFVSSVHVHLLKVRKELPLSIPERHLLVVMLECVKEFISMGFIMPFSWPEGGRNKPSLVVDVIQDIGYLIEDHRDKELKKLNYSQAYKKEDS